MSKFSPCPDCQRHVLVSDVACPFCGFSGKRSLSRQVPSGGTKRAMIFALGASLAAAACGEDDSSSDPGQAMDGNSKAGAGNPGASSGNGAGAAPPAPGPGDTAQPVYGAVVPPDPTPGGGGAGGADEGAGGDTGATMDAGAPEEGAAGNPAVQPLYGAVPAPED